MITFCAWMLGLVMGIAIAAALAVAELNEFKRKWNENHRDY